MVLDVEDHDGIGEFFDGFALDRRDIPNGHGVVNGGHGAANGNLVVNGESVLNGH